MFAISMPRLRTAWLALAIALIAASAMSTSAVAGSPIAHTVKAGGPDACFAFGARPGCDGNYSLSAIQYTDGSVRGTYTDRFAGNGGIHGFVDCVMVDGNEAWVSGWITNGQVDGEDLAGLPFTTRVRDNGTSASTFDEVSSSHTGDDTSCLEQADFDLAATPQGNVIVK
jgi:hypothetical protein